MAETVIAPGNKLQVHRRAPQRERPRMSGFLGAGGAASDSQLAKGGKVRRRQHGGRVRPVEPVEPEVQEGYRPATTGGGAGRFYDPNAATAMTTERATYQGLKNRESEMEWTARGPKANYADEIAPQRREEGRMQPYNLAKGGKVKPGKGKHRLHLIIVMLGKRHPGAISEKAAKRRKLDAVER